ncbi:hypothetical protein HJG60_010393 [Phyllostomus discolor]|uniref:Uncharacterized protein n=1 Tax=Phyllostomus discolor TaxID=89673 RepID=A0A834EMX9_9CHIR|nr:hypothetical protein HJG60_010393 [Phyllostomus discolor]
MRGVTRVHGLCRGPRQRPGTEAGGRSNQSVCRGCRSRAPEPAPLKRQAPCPPAPEAGSPGSRAADRTLPGWKWPPLPAFPRTAFSIRPPAFWKTLPSRILCPPWPGSWCPTAVPWPVQVPRRRRGKKPQCRKRCPSSTGNASTRHPACSPQEKGMFVSWSHPPTHPQ